MGSRRPNAAPSRAPKRGHVAIVHDVSDRKRLEAALQESEETYRTLYDNIPLMCLTRATDGAIRSINAHGATELGYEPGDLVGRPALMLFHPEDHLVVGRELTAVAAKPEAIEYWEARMVRSDGGIVWARASGRVIHRADGEDVLLMACSNITRRRQAEQEIMERKRQLRALTARMVLAEEQERHRIATGLHDDLGHTLALARLRLGKLPGADRSSEEAQTIRDIDELLDQAIEATRSLTFDLSSPILYELGFEAALGRLHVSIKTVGTHREHVMSKLDIHNIAGLTKYAIREGLTSSAG